MIVTSDPITIKKKDKIIKKFGQGEDKGQVQSYYVTSTKEFEKISISLSCVFIEKILISEDIIVEGYNV